MQDFCRRLLRERGGGAYKDERHASKRERGRGRAREEARGRARERTREQERERERWKKRTTEEKTLFVVNKHT